MSEALLKNQQLASDVPRPNLLQNGGFEQWQRGNGPFTASGAFTTDRWMLGLGGSDTCSVSKNTANLDTGSIASAACTFVFGTGAGSSGVSQFALRTSDGNQITGKTVSLSVRVKTTTANAVRAAITTDGTGGTTTYSSYHTGGGAFETLTVTITVPADASYIRPYAATFWASCTAYLDNASLVYGTVAADYGSLPPADDIARCLRYYETIGDAGAGDTILAGIADVAGRNIRGTFFFKARKAVAPTVTKVGTWSLTNVGSQPANDVSSANESRWSLGTSSGAGEFYALNSPATTQFTVEANP